MLVILVVLISLIGLAQSIFELVPSEKKNPYKNYLAVAYIFGFLFSIYIAVLQDRDSFILNSTIERISSRISRVDSLSESQLSKINNSLIISDSLMSKSDSLNESIISIINAKDSLLLQYSELNKKIKNQLDFDYKVLSEQAPIIDLKGVDVRITKYDSLKYLFESCIRNYGKRNAMILSGSGYVLFVDNTNSPFYYLRIPGNTDSSIIVPNEKQQMALCYYSYGTSDIERLKSRSSFAVICLNIQFKDLIDNTIKNRKFYVGWLPNSKLDGPQFGGLKDWQFNIAKSWEINNHFFK